MESIPNCPKCNSEGFKYDVSSKGRILYRCKNPKCLYRYNSLSGTKLQYTQLSDETIKQLYDLLYRSSTPIPVPKISEQIGVSKESIYRHRKLWDAERKKGNDHVSLPRF